MLTLATAAAPSIIPAAASDADAEIIAAGEKFEQLLKQYIPAWFEWAKRHRAAKAETVVKFGGDYRSSAWSEPEPGRSPAQRYLKEAVGRNGAKRASEATEALCDEMEPIANLIREAKVETLAGLRAKALVAIWEARPTCATHKGLLNFDDEISLWSLLNGVVAVTGLSGLYGSFIEQVESDATEELDDA